MFCVLLATLLLNGAASLPHHTLGTEPISVHPETLRLVDEHFREVNFHGMNVVVKQFPWIPDMDHFNVATSFSTKDMETFQELGFNAIRLGTMWAGLEPERNEYNMTYLEALRDLVTKAEGFGIYSLLDMHQDVMSSKFCGEGFPPWAAVPANDSLFPWPMTPVYNTTDGIPSWEECAMQSWSSYYFTQATGSAFQNLYDNNFGLRDSWASFWKTVATGFANSGAAVLGYELMNEPWAGDAVANISLMIPGVADRVNLQNTWDVGAQAIRSVDASHAVFFEGVTWDWVGVGFTDVPGGAEWRNKSVLSYHFYQPPDFSMDVQFAARVDDMKRLQCGGFMTEAWLYDWAILDKCDEVVQSWLLWIYKPFYGTEPWSGSIWNANGTLRMDYVSILSRTYAKIVAGTTVVQTFNNVTHSYLLVFRGDNRVTSNTTRIYFNEAVHYPNGFNVVVTTSHGPEASWTHSAHNHIEVQHSLSAIQGNSTVTITVESL
ncbi:cellulase-like protein, putative [Bodo saltans]|uniref:Cellulase-like protein, putative n=1 Tax=Bodo saltans TaxID=75058 RepID=A0A0S4IMG7_BODSA|nr:cellulase-like protein, putative [Bodo saltans]|eukprot:CUE72090.1 cellulase-like protein, putative [Bodo saltans]